MESLRNFLTGPRLLIVVLVCALPFVFLGTSSLGSVTGGSFGKINGEDVTETDLQIASNSTVQKFRSVYGEDFDFDMLDEDFKAQAIKQELIIQKVLFSEAKSMGLINKLTEQETKKNIVQSPLFQVDGLFNENVYEAQVNSSGFTKESYIETMTGLTASNIFRSALYEVNFITEKELIEVASLLEKSTDIDFIKISLEDLKSEIVNSDDELIAYYDDNELSFFSDLQKGFKYFILDQFEYKDDIQIPDSYLIDGYQSYLDEFDDNAQIRISHIMIDKSNYESRETALDMINKIENLLNNGDDFSELASNYSEDIVTSSSGGDLDYFDKDIFPIEFDEALKNLDLDQISSIIELDDTFHILKVTEKNFSEPLSEEEVKNELINELVETESFALLQDDFDNIESMIEQNNSFDTIAKSLSKEILSSDLFSESNYNFDIDEVEIKNYLFSPNSEIDSPYVIDLGNKIFVMTINQSIEPELQSFEDVKTTIGAMLSSSKAQEKITLLAQEILSISDNAEKINFIDAYNYVEKDSFINVKRYSSLLPKEVLNEVFISPSGKVIVKDASNGDKYIVTIKNFNQPLDSDLKTIISEYNAFGEDAVITKMNQIINDDIFDSARVNLNNLIF